MIDERIVRHIAQLARIDLEDAEMTALTKDLQSILEYVQKLEEVDVFDVVPLAHVTGRKNVMRDDISSEQSLLPNLQHDLLEKQAPGYEGGAILVPRVLNE